jgi:hypothetical protein
LKGRKVRKDGLEGSFTAGHGVGSGFATLSYRGRRKGLKDLLGEVFEWALRNEPRVIVEGLQVFDRLRNITDGITQAWVSYY